jgi:hypothetical protein
LKHSSCKPRIANDCQQNARNAEELRNDAPCVVSERAWPCLCLYFGLLASRTMRLYISIVLSHQLVVLCYSNSKEYMHFLWAAKILGHRALQATGYPSALIPSALEE